MQIEDTALLNILLILVDIGGTPFSHSLHAGKKLILVVGAARIELATLSLEISIYPSLSREDFLLPSNSLTRVANTA